MRRWIPGIALGLILGLSIPVSAHLTEHALATDPVTSMYVTMQNYSTKFVLDCDTPDPTGQQFRSGHIDGVEAFPFSSMRIHVGIDSLHHGLNPTEHWNVAVSVKQAIAKTNGQLSFRSFWDQSWAHQNTTAHQNSHLAVKTNLYRLDERPGTWQVTVVLEGQESGTDGTSGAISNHDDWTNLPITPNGGNITIAPAAGGVFAVTPT